MTGTSTENWQRAGFGLYVHWPFCAAKCPYCDFNSHVAASVDHARWRDALLRDLTHWAARTPGRVLSSIFFGGGTPSLMPATTVAAIIDAARAAWSPANDLEVTLEANPTSVDAARFADYAAAGVTRMSVGLQALDDADLRRLGRLHTAAEGRAAFDVAQGVVERVSFDLIYARQDQDEASWRRELTRALGFAGEHLSLYQLTIEDGTAFGVRHAAGGLRGLPDEDRSVALWETTQELTEAAGFTRYETSNHARPGAEARHNLIYWRGGDWVGIGPGAHGRIGTGAGRVATEAAAGPAAWLARNEATGTGTLTETVLPQSEIIEERYMMGLRMRKGLDVAVLAGEDSLPDPDAFARLVDDGLLVRRDGRIATTDRGALLLNPILGSLLTAPGR